MTVAEYLAKYPGAPTVSEAARASESRKKGKAPKAPKDLKGGEENPPIPEIPAEDENLLKFGVARLRVREGLTDSEQALVPAHDETWVPGDRERKWLSELALAVEDGDNVFISGPPGIGKTTLVKELAAICNQPLIRIPMDGDMRRADFVGEKNIVIDEKTGEAVTSWTDGLLPVAAESGHWLLLDEVDAAPPHIAFVLHGVLEESRHLALAGDGGRQVRFHPGFRVFATANTLGRGDDDGLYAGTNVLNEAFLDRFNTTIGMSYPDEKTESEIIMAKAGASADVTRRMLSVAKAVREAYEKDECSVSLSPRRLISWARKSVRLGDVSWGAEVSLLNKLGPEDRKLVGNLIQRYFGGKVK